MKILRLTFLAVLLISIMAACNNETSESNQEKDIKEMVHDYSVGDFEDITASITSHELIVTDQNNKETTYDLPEDEFFVSIAPFETTTHECAIHSLTGCQGELVEVDFQVHIEDEDGNVVIDKTMTTFENGFIDLWLPRDKTFNVTIEHNGKVAESVISTFEGDNTCITTMQLV